MRVSKGELRLSKIKIARLQRAVPTLDLRRKQLNREIKEWEKKFEGQERKVEYLKGMIQMNPHHEISLIVVISQTFTTSINIAGVMLKLLDRVDFKDALYSKFVTPPSFDKFLKLQKELLEEEKRMDFLKESLLKLEEELMVTTQRINLFEKRLIPKAKGDIRYIKGRLEDGERASVMVAKIAQGKMLSEQNVVEVA